MCLRKLKIVNPVKTEHLTGFDKPYIKVACCKCPECRKQRSHDWVFRSYWEFLDQPNNTFFITLTYDDDHLPRYNGKPCFNREHIKLFLKKLRHRIGSFRYLCVPEYGGFFRRSHYHLALSGFDKNLSDLQMYWHVRDSWQYGDMVSVDKMDSVQGSVMKAVSYICEYVTKDPSFDVFDYEKDFPSIYDSRIQVSKGYGSKFFDVLTPEILKRGYYHLPLGKNGIQIKFQIPRYYELKKCYNYHWNKEKKCVELSKNQLGIDLAIYKHSVHYSFLLDLLKATKPHLMLVSANIRQKVKFMLKKYNFKSFESLHDFVLSQKGFKYYLYHRDFMVIFSDHYPEVTKYDPVFNDFYYDGGTLDDYITEKDYGLFFTNHLSGKQEYGRYYKIFNDYMSIFDEYERIKDDCRSEEMNQQFINRSLRHNYNRLKKRPDIRARLAKVNSLRGIKTKFDVKCVKSQYCFTFNF